MNRLKKFLYILTSMYTCVDKVIHKFNLNLIYKIYEQKLFNLKSNPLLDLVFGASVDFFVLSFLILKFVENPSLASFYIFLSRYYNVYMLTRINVVCNVVLFTTF